MKLTTKGRYAVTAMLDLALYQHKGPVPLQEIANRRHISLAYLEQLFASLRRHGLVKSVRGNKGGYLLNHEPAAITLVHIMEAIGERIDGVQCCGTNHNGQHESFCLTQSLWQDFNDMVRSFMRNNNLAQLLNRLAGHSSGDSTANTAPRINLATEELFAIA